MKPPLDFLMFASPELQLINYMHRFGDDHHGYTTIKVERENAEHRFSLDVILYSLIKCDSALPEKALGPGPRESGCPEGKCGPLLTPPETFEFLIPGSGSQTPQ